MDAGLAAAGKLPANPALLAAFGPYANYMLVNLTRDTVSEAVWTAGPFRIRQDSFARGRPIAQPTDALQVAYVWSDLVGRWVSRPPALLPMWPDAAGRHAARRDGSLSVFWTSCFTMVAVRAGVLPRAPLLLLVSSQAPKAPELFLSTSGQRTLESRTTAGAFLCALLLACVPGFLPPAHLHKLAAEQARLCVRGRTWKLYRQRQIHGRAARGRAAQDPAFEDPDVFELEFLSLPGAPEIDKPPPPPPLCPPSAPQAMSLPEPYQLFGPCAFGVQHGARAPEGTPPSQLLADLCTTLDDLGWAVVPPTLGGLAEIRAAVLQCAMLVKVVKGPAVECYKVRGTDTAAFTAAVKAVVSATVGGRPAPPPLTRRGSPPPPVLPLPATVDRLVARLNSAYADVFTAGVFGTYALAAGSAKVAAALLADGPMAAALATHLRDPRTPSNLAAVLHVMERAVEGGSDTAVRMCAAEVGLLQSYANSACVSPQDWLLRRHALSLLVALQRADPDAFPEVAVPETVAPWPLDAPPSKFHADLADMRAQLSVARA